MALRAAGRSDEAEEALREALALRQRTPGADHPQPAETVRELATLGT